MKTLKSLILVLVSAFSVTSACAQADAYINIITQNAGLVNLGGTVYLQVDVGNNGPAAIGVNKVRSQLSIPAIAGALVSAQQTDLPAGWTILTNTGSVITICNGSDIIPAGAQRTALIKLQGNNIGGPSTIVGQLSFGPGTGVCTGPGTLNGDNTVNNNSTTSITTVPAGQCTLSSLVAAAGTISCNGSTTTLTANSGQPTNVEYSIDGSNFQVNNTFTVSAGTYTVTARRSSDLACTITSNTVTVSEPTELDVIASATPVSIPGGNDGTATANPSGATPPYTYLWSAGGQLTQTITGLTQGSYDVTVTDANGCATLATAIVAGVLPLTLIDFNARLVNCQPLLNWITEGEINTVGFEIERGKVTDHSWITIGTLRATGNSSVRTVYHFIDKDLNTSSEQVLYRLKMIDKDGHYKYSDILRVFTSCDNIRVNVYPNPVENGRLYIGLTGATGSTEVTLVSSSGQVILKTTIVNGTNYINTSHIAAGLYVLNIKDANGFDKNVKINIQL